MYLRCIGIPIYMVLRSNNKYIVYNYVDDKYTVKKYQNKSTLHSVTTKFVKNNFHFDYF